jgi:uncharacterized protein involved in exopolysaccharide biosynthesis
MKLWGSMKQGANKLAFDAEKVLRVKRQESSIAGLRDKVQAQYTELGQTAMALMEEGAIAHPQLAQFANQISVLQDQIKQEAQKLALMQAEEYQAEETAIPAGSSTPAMPEASSAPAEEPPAPPPAPSAY